MYFIWIAFLAPIFGGAACIIESKLSNHSFKHQTTMIFYISLMNCVFLPLILLLGRPSVPSDVQMMCYFGLAAIDVIYLYPFYTAMKVIDTSIVAALFALGQITIPLMSYLFLGEVLTLVQYIGFTVIIMASVALSVKGTKIPKLNKAFYFMLFASLLKAGYYILEKYVLTIDGNWINMVVYPNLISGLMPFAFLLVPVWRKDIFKHFPPYLNKFKMFAINEFLCFLMLAAQVYGMSGLSPVESASIGGTEPIFMLVMSYFLLKQFNIKLNEKITHRILMKKVFCFVLITLGVILVVQ